MRRRTKGAPMSEIRHLALPLCPRSGCARCMCRRRVHCSRGRCSRCATLGTSRLLGDGLHERVSLPYGLAGPGPLLCRSHAAGGRAAVRGGGAHHGTRAWISRRRELHHAGMAATVGKGRRSEAVRQACIEHGVGVFRRGGRCGCVSCEVRGNVSHTISYDDLGTEALRRIDRRAVSPCSSASTFGAATCTAHDVCDGLACRGDALPRRLVDSRNRKGLLIVRGTATETIPIAERGIFITFEGGEGAGKTTHIRFLAECAARAWAARSLCLREPGGTRHRRGAARSGAGPCQRRDVRRSRAARLRGGARADREAGHPAGARTRGRRGAVRPLLRFHRSPTRCAGAGFRAIVRGAGERVRLPGRPGARPHHPAGPPRRRHAAGSAPRDAPHGPPTGSSSAGEDFHARVNEGFPSACAEAEPEPHPRGGVRRAQVRHGRARCSRRSSTCSPG